jgi:putative ABC transport system permease protein
MAWTKVLADRLRALWDRDRVRDEIEEEYRFHIELRTEQNVERGMAPEDARRDAEQRFGHLPALAEAGYDVRGGGWVEALWSDVRFGARMLRKHPLTSVVAVGTLALGIGATTAVFGVVNGVVLRPLPYPDPDRLVVLWERPAQGDSPVSYQNFLDWSAASTSFERLAAYRSDQFNLTGAGEPEHPDGMVVTASLLPALGVEPAEGRGFAESDDRPDAAPVAILSHGFWLRKFGGDATAIGRQITLADRSFTIVGVLPADFRFESNADILVPIGLQAERFRLRGLDPRVTVIGRMREGVSVEQAQAEVGAIMGRLAAEYPDVDGGRGVRVESLAESTVEGVRTMLFVLLGAVAFLLLIVCANVANLLLAKSAARHREVAVRTALGASRGRVARQFLTESLLLAGLGGLLGLVGAVWGTGLLAATSPAELPRASEVGVALRVLAFAVLVSLTAGVAFGLAPALQAAKVDFNSALKESARGSTGGRRVLRGSLVVSEISLALVLLVGAGLMAKTFVKLTEVDPGFDPSGVLALQMSISAGKDDGAKVASFLDETRRRVGALPGVRSVSYSNGFPFVGANQVPFSVEGRPEARAGLDAAAVMYIVSPEYFKTLGVRMSTGRSFGAADARESPRVAVVDEALARQYFPGEDPVGRRIMLDVPGLDELGPLEIVGVAAHVKHHGLVEGGTLQPQFYLDFDQTPLERLPRMVRRVHLAVRADGEPAALAAAVRREILAANPDQPVFAVRPVDEILAESVAAARFSARILTIFAAVSLLLATVGIYGVMSYSVSTRAREMGIRVALGARPSSLVRLVLGQGAKQAVAGVAIGLVAALGLTRFLSSMLFGVSATDPATFAGVALLLLGAALVACYVPARRATRVDPASVLQSE